MEKINIAELLKDCPRGMELDCTMYNSVTLLRVNDEKHTIFPIKVLRSDGCEICLTKYGQYAYMDDAKCVIFPKSKTTWEGFTPPCKFKDGDILYIQSVNTWICIYREGGEIENVYYKYVATTCSNFVYDDFPLCDRGHVREIRIATEEEKQKLFDAIKSHGYVWNAETKTLEDSVESKEDIDRLVMSGIYFDKENYADEVELHLGNYEIEIRDGKTYAVFKNQKTNTLEKFPKFKVGDRVQRVLDSVLGVIVKIDDKGYYINFLNNINGVGYISFTLEKDYVLVPNKFDINTLKRFESKVLVRNCDSDYWKPAIFGFSVKDKNASFCVEGGNFFNKCIPYEGNEYLLGTRKDCNDFYKTW